jgi:hypothetical protein
MPDETIQFTISIPVREEDAETVINAFLNTNPYNTSYQTNTVDLAGNIIENPITPAMYVEDCIAYYLMDITKNYLIKQASDSATDAAAQQANLLVNNLKNWIDSL